MVFLYGAYSSRRTALLECCGDFFIDLLALGDGLKKEGKWVRGEAALILSTRLDWKNVGTL
jgi:hypothetical protein